MFAHDADGDQIRSLPTQLSRWGSFWAKVHAFVEAVELSPAELQQRQLNALEAELVRLRAIVEPGRPG